MLSDNGNKGTVWTKRILPEGKLDKATRKYVPRVNLRLMEKRVKAIMNREVLKLLGLSEERLLNKIEAESLRAYAKLIPELAKREEEENEKISDKELKAIIASQEPKNE